MQEFDSSKPPVVAGICDPKKYLTQLKYLSSEYLILKLKNNLALIFIIHFEMILNSVFTHAEKKLH